MSYNKHLDLDAREIIENGLNNHSTKTAIAKVLGKDISTVCKEIKLHRQPIPKNSFNHYTDCINAKDCPNNICKKCENYTPTRCIQLEKVGVCNGCEFINSLKCKKTKYRYSATKAQKEYEDDLVDSRSGVDLTTSKAKMIGDIIKPLIDKGQSIYAIIKNHPELGICEKTLYNYIEQGVFSSNGIIDLDLRRKVSMKIPKSKKKKTICSKPREFRKFLKGRSTKEFNEYILTHPNDSIVEMDTVYNNESTGPFVQTFYICSINIMIGIYHNTKTAEDMLEGLKYVYDLLGNDLFTKYFAILRPDRGSEFTKAEEYEKLGCKVFYCDPMASWQKPHVERTHVLFRYICPKEKDLHSLGLNSQEDVNLIFSHINSYAREELKGKSPIDIYLFYNDNCSLLLDKLNIKKISPDEINLTPNLIKK